jgi:protein-S-isoprenylcysteine O-methyltransferase Ste14
MIKTIVFLVLSIPIAFLSWRSLFSLKNHGFYRFIAWECILWLLLSNIIFWFEDWYSTPQIISWILLFGSIPVLLFGLSEMKKTDRQDQKRDSSLYNFEKTSELIDTGIFEYIRHPLYGSLLLLTWGTFLKQVDIYLFFVAALSTIALILSAKMEEKENIRYFGDYYLIYMRKTKMFIPFIL